MKEETRGSHSCAGTNGVTGCERPLLDFNLFGRKCNWWHQAARRGGEPLKKVNPAPLNWSENVGWFFSSGSWPLATSVHWHNSTNNIQWTLFTCTFKSLSLQNMYFTTSVTWNSFGWSWCVYSSQFQYKTFYHIGHTELSFDGLPERCPPALSTS